MRAKSASDGGGDAGFGRLIPLQLQGELVHGVVSLSGVNPVVLENEWVNAVMFDQNLRGGACGVSLLSDPWHTSFLMKQAHAEQTCCMSRGEKESGLSTAWFCQLKWFGVECARAGGRNQDGEEQMQGGGEARREAGEENTLWVQQQTCHWFLLRCHFHTLCTSSHIDLLQNFPCRAEVNSLVEDKEMRDLPLTTSQFPASIHPR